MEINNGYRYIYLMNNFYNAGIVEKIIIEKNILSTGPRRISGASSTKTHPDVMCFSSTHYENMRAMQYTYNYFQL